MVVATAIAKLGAARVLFGSEYPLQDPSVEVLKVKALDLDALTHAAVMGGSVLALIGGWR
jgi:hypothetical protein